MFVLSVCSLSWTFLVNSSPISPGVEWGDLEGCSDGLFMFLCVACRAEAAKASILYHCWTIVMYDVPYVRPCGDVEWLLY